MSTVYDIIRRPIVTEKTTAFEGTNQVVFEVSLDANKHMIRDAVERLFDVKVIRVNTAVMQGKRKRAGKNFGKRSNWKKALVTVADGEDLNFYTGL